MPGRHPLPISECKVPGCDGKIIFLSNPQWGRCAAVDPETLSQDDRDRIHETGNSLDVDFDMTRHGLHKYHCKNPEWRPPERKGRK